MFVYWYTRLLYLLCTFIIHNRSRHSSYIILCLSIGIHDYYIYYVYLVHIADHDTHHILYYVCLLVHTTINLLWIFNIRKNVYEISMRIFIMRIFNIIYNFVYIFHYINLNLNIEIIFIWRWNFYRSHKTSIPFTGNSQILKIAIFVFLRLCAVYRCVDVCGYLYLFIHLMTLIMYY